MAGKGYVRVWRSPSVAVVSKMPKRTWQVNYKCISKESCVSILRAVHGELPDSFSRLHSGCRAPDRGLAVKKSAEWKDIRTLAAATLQFLLCSVLLFVTCTFHAASLAAQSSPDQADSPGAQEKQARKLATQTKTITGCLQKGYEPDEFSITAEDGKVWGLRSSAVKLDGHLGHKVTVSGLITHESKARETKKGKMESAPGNEESGDLRVARLKMVSETCGK